MVHLNRLYMTVEMIQRLCTINTMSLFGMCSIHRSQIIYLNEIF